MSGAFVACAGLSLSIASKNIVTLILTYGIIGGFGIGMITLPTVIIVGYYFDSKREQTIIIIDFGNGTSLNQSFF